MCCISINNNCAYFLSGIQIYSSEIWVQGSAEGSETHLEGTGVRSRVHHLEVVPVRDRQSRLRHRVFHLKPETKMKKRTNIVTDTRNRSESIIIVTEAEAEVLADPDVPNMSQKFIAIVSTPHLIYTLVKNQNYS